MLLAKRDSCANPKNKNIAGEQMTSSVGGERDDLGFDSDLVDSLVSQLEAASDDDSGNEAEHGTNHSQWPTIRYAAIMTRVHHFVKEKQRVQSYLADEVAKAESELDNGDGSQKRVAPDVSTLICCGRFRTESSRKAMGIFEGMKFDLLEKAWCGVYSSHRCPFIVLSLSLAFGVAQLQSKVTSIFG